MGRGRTLHIRRENECLPEASDEISHSRTVARAVTRSVEVLHAASRRGLFDVPVELSEKLVEGFSLVLVERVEPPGDEFLVRRHDLVV